ncbi:MAG: I78 family peptidase inhibitor [Alphaproteobacteria bacterium]
MKQILKLMTITAMILSVASCGLYGDYKRNARERELKGKCDLTYAKTLHGRNFSDLAISERPVNYRVLKPGSFQTKDYRPGRVNVMLNSSGIITKTYCG